MQSPEVSVILCVYVVSPRDIIKIRLKLVILYFVYIILKMSELQNKTVTMELNNLMQFRKFYFNARVYITSTEL
jgi:hypothetical protein